KKMALSERQLLTLRATKRIRAGGFQRSIPADNRAPLDLFGAALQSALHRDQRALVALLQSARGDPVFAGMDRLASARPIDLPTVGANPKVVFDKVNQCIRVRQ